MKREIGILRVVNDERVVDVVAAGMADPVFGTYAPDEFTGYARIRFAKTLPMVTGPESLSGGVFGIHPAVVARSHAGIVHKQMNYEHTLTTYGKREDRICGCVLASAFPEEPEGGWVIPESVEDAPSIMAMAALFKHAKGMSKMLGDHMSGRRRMSVSMEFTFFWDEMGIFDPRERVCYDRGEIPKNLWAYLAEDDKRRLIIKRNAGRRDLVLAIGGRSGRMLFSGVAYTGNPAEDTAAVDEIAASREIDGRIAASVVDGSQVYHGERLAFLPGMPVKWSGGQWNRGVVERVVCEGTVKNLGKTLHATPEEPGLLIRMPNGQRVLRRASSVKG